MRKLIVFNHMPLDGYFTDAKGDMSCARNDNPDADWECSARLRAAGVKGSTLRTPILKSAKQWKL